MKSLIVSKAPNEAFALTNSVVVHPDDISGAGEDCLLVNGDYVFSVLTDRSVTRGHLGTSSFHRTWAKMSLNEQVQVKLVQVQSHLEKLVIQVIINLCMYLVPTLFYNILFRFNF